MFAWHSLVGKSSPQPLPSSFFYCALICYKTCTAWRCLLPFISFYLLVHQALSSLLLRLARRSSFDKRLQRWKTIGSPHILPIDWIYKWLIASLVCSDFLIVMNIPFSIFPIEKYVGNGMGTWYTSYVPLLTAALGFSQVHSETFMAIFHFKLGMISPTR